MARTADPNLKEAVIDAVLPLLDKQGQSALSMRAVAKAAGTTTPTLYSRFKDQDSLLVAITLRVSQELLTRLLLCKSVKEMAKQYLRYVSDYPHRYEISIATRANAWERNEAKPIYNLFMKRLREEIGDSKAAVEQLALAIIALLHGTAMLITAVGRRARLSTDLERATIAVLNRILKPAAYCGQDSCR